MIFVVDFLLYNHYEYYIALTGYSDVSIENGYYGRLYVTHYEHGYSKSEVCTSGFNRYEGEALCQAHGYSYNTYTAYAIYQNHTFQTNRYNNALNRDSFLSSFFNTAYLQETATTQLAQIVVHTDTAHLIVTFENLATVHRLFTYNAMVIVLDFFTKKINLKKFTVIICFQYYYCIFFNVYFYPIK